MAPQQQVQQLEQCAQECKNIISDLQNLAQKANDIEMKSVLKEAAHHLEISIQECNYATQATP